MTKKLPEHLKSLEKQYDTSPYPHIPLEKSPKDDYNSLFIYNLTTSHYLYQQKIINPQNQLILDVGCGSGWTSLQLALANPSAHIVCIDLSQKSLDAAQERLNFHSCKNAEYHKIAIEDVTELGYEFDYINCENVLYLTDDPVLTLKALKSVLKPHGIIRTNLHSYYQRFVYYRSQELFKCLGLLEENPDDFEIEIVTETIKNLGDQVSLKRISQNIFNDNDDPTSDHTKQRILMNYLLQNDKGYNVPQLFEILEKSQLKFLSMVNWRQWEIRDLFKDKNNLPTVWEFVLENASEAEKLHLFELIHPIHRLIDFWCTHDDLSFKPLSTWENQDWEKAKIYIHPNLKSAKIKEDLLKTIKEKEPWEISKFIKLPALAPVTIPHNLSSVLLPLWESSKTLHELVYPWLKIEPINLISLAEKTESEATEEIKNLIIKLETFLYLLVEK